ncbi:FAGR057Cp [Eremothecium gossypii FDAG1]|nr:FAGR057Cp [Eremothecium gossypii FDAG1]
MGSSSRNKRGKRSVDWEAYVGEETAQQLRKVGGEGVPVPAELARQWSYTYSVGWLYNVCASYWTEAGKPLWKEVRFDERLMLADVGVGEGVFREVQEQLLRAVSQSKAAEVEDWDAVVKPLLRGAVADYDGDAEFAALGVSAQFEVVYRLIKLAERRSIAFRNYVTNHEALFQFPQIWEDEQTSVLVLPGSKVVRKRVVPRKGVGLRIPVKLRNCTVRYEDPGGAVELAHYDYSSELDAYLKDIEVEYEVLAYNWPTFLAYVQELEEGEFREFFCELLPYAAENEVYGAKLWAGLVKERSMQELITRRKRSSRLVAREEETQRRQVEDDWHSKLDERDRFLRLRSKLVAKRAKKTKDALWTVLWERFESDAKIEKMRRRNEAATPEAGGDELLTPAERYALEQGQGFLAPVVPVAEPARPLAVPCNELPDEYCITKTDFDRLASHGIPVEDVHEDSKDWYFQCPCGVEEVSPGLESPALQQALVCCDQCLRWQHWDCQHPAAIELLAAGKDSHNFALVPPGPAPTRRASRRGAAADPYQDPDRPTARRRPVGEAEPFLCSWCVAALERTLRASFRDELTATRLRERKQAEERERRKRLKEEKRRQVLFHRQQQPVATLLSQHAVPVAQSRDQYPLHQPQLASWQVHRPSPATHILPTQLPGPARTGLLPHAQAPATAKHEPQPETLRPAQPEGTNDHDDANPPSHSQRSPASVASSGASYPTDTYA